MSDRANSITVVIEKTTRIDDLESILKAIRMIKGVIATRANVADIGDYSARAQARHELGASIMKVLYPDE